MRIKQPGNDEMLKMVDNSIDGLDQLRAQALYHLQILQDGRNSSLMREQSRLKKKYGSNHPRVQKLSNRIQYNQGAAQEIKIEVAKVKIIVPNIDPQTWMVHGRVMEAEGGNPIPGVTVSLYTAKGTWVKELGYSCTDEQGYYSIRYTKDVIKDKTENGQQKDDAAKVEPLADAKEREAAARKCFYLGVTNKDQQVIHTESEPVCVKLGQIDYRLIILSKSQCTPPADDKKKQPTPTPVDPRKDLRRWAVKGAVTYNDKTPAVGLTVSLHDKEKKYSEALGNVRTDKKGEFKLEYKEENIKGLFEEKPDLFVMVVDEQGARLYRSPKSIKSGGENVEGLHITIKKNA